MRAARRRRLCAGKFFGGGQPDRKEQVKAWEACRYGIAGRKQVHRAAGGHAVGESPAAPQAVENLPVAGFTIIAGSDMSCVTSRSSGIDQVRAVRARLYFN